MKDLFALLSGHYMKYWYVVIAFLISIAFYIFIGVFRAAYSSRHKKNDYQAALRALSANLGYSSLDGRSICRMITLDEKDPVDRIFFEHADGTIREIDPKSSSMVAYQVYFRKYAALDRIQTVAFYIFATCMVAYSVTFVAYLIMIT